MVTPNGALMLTKIALPMRSVSKLVLASNSKSIVNV
jgi:hypothetical protein